ncbi:hypothetical protein [Aliiruegeria lutimaris]|nr:hypothetical protein [Aliiruegeria lutimaris]
MLQRFTPTDKGDDIRSMADLNELLISGEALLRGLGIAALAWLPWRLRRPELLPLPMLFALYALAMTVAGAHVTPRYTLVFLPLLAAALSCIFVSFLPRREWGALAPSAGIAMLAGGPIKTQAMIEIAPSASDATQINALTALSASLKPSETLVICAMPGSHARITPALASRYAANRRPFVGLRDPGRQF